MKVIDLTDSRKTHRPRVGMITRFPPSTSASAPASSELTARLMHRYGIPVDVIRLVRPTEPGSGTLPVVMDLNPRWHMSAQLAAHRANRCDIAVIQVDRHIPLHMIAELVSELEIPVVLCVDDVAPVGTDETRSLADLAGRADTVVVHSEVARRRLESEAEGPIEIEVIPHGCSWRAIEPPSGPHGKILTWGFLAPGMGAERVIRALPLLDDLDPLPRYRLIGVTDPRWARREVDAYRSDLTAEADRLGVADRFELVPIHLSMDELEAEIADTDLIAVPYDSRDRSASRILTEAVSAGRPVVATAFPGAIEMLASGAGTTVAHDDGEEMAGAIRRYLTDEDAYLRACRMAAALSPGVNWDEAARKLAHLLTVHGDLRRVAT